MTWHEAHKWRVDVPFCVDFEILSETSFCIVSRCSYSSSLRTNNSHLIVIHLRWDSRKWDMETLHCLHLKWHLCRWNWGFDGGEDGGGKVPETLVSCTEWLCQSFSTVHVYCVAFRQTATRHWACSICFETQQILTGLDVGVCYVWIGFSLVTGAILV
jgi:hypothetical protein